MISEHNASGRNKGHIVHTDLISELGNLILGSEQHIDQKVQSSVEPSTVLSTDSLTERLQTSDSTVVQSEEPPQKPLSGIIAYGFGYGAEKSTYWKKHKRVVGQMKKILDSAAKSNIPIFFLPEDDGMRSGPVKAGEYSEPRYTQMIHSVIGYSQIVEPVCVGEESVREKKKKDVTQSTKYILSTPLQIVLAKKLCLEAHVTDVKLLFMGEYQPNTIQKWIVEIFQDPADISHDFSFLAYKPKFNLEHIKVDAAAKKKLFNTVIPVDVYHKMP